MGAALSIFGSHIFMVNLGQVSEAGPLVEIDAAEGQNGNFKIRWRTLRLAKLCILRRSFTSVQQTVPTAFRGLLVDYVSL